MNRAELLNRLKDSVTAAERHALEHNADGLVIGRYNRVTMLRMLAFEARPDAGSVDAADVEGLKAALQSYLNRHMPDRPEGHKWIILSCIFLALVVGEPMHPQEMVRWRRARGRYVCPARVMAKDSPCRWCVCQGEVNH